MFSVNVGSHEGLIGDAGEDDAYVNRVRIVTAVALCVLFGCLIGGIIWANVDLLGEDILNKWPGTSMVVSLLLLTVSALIYRLKRFAESTD